jgi:hypoxanthine-DNA glycosylase
MDKSLPPAPHKRSFSPIVDDRTRLLVLGSLPGETSLSEARYYAHPRNHFWPLIGEVIGLDLVGMDYESRLRALRAAGIGLWDVVGSALRAGSLDAAIRDYRANDLVALAESLPRLRAIGFNGAKAANIGARLLAGRIDLSLVALPSSSPAYTLPYAAKRDAWVKLSRYL